MDNIRYARLEALDGVGAEGIAKLSKTRILIVGCGALGSVAAMYLAASGVGTIGIADFDTIDLSNLQRQIFYDESTLGKSKAIILAERMKNLNSTISVEVFETVINRKNVREIFRRFDFVIDGSDNPSTKLMTSEICENQQIPYCIGGVYGLNGQVMSWAPKHAGYKEIFGEVECCSGFTPCSIGGVLGPTAGVVASVQAAEAIKFVTGVGRMLYDRLFTIDLASMNTCVI